MWTGKWGQAFKTVKQTKNVILASTYLINRIFVASMLKIQFFKDSFAQQKK
jgi:hypothetical protein